MTDTDIRVALAEKLGWTHTQIVQGEPVGLSPSRHNIHILPSLYDLCLDGEERLTDIRQQQLYISKLADTLARVLYIETTDAFDTFRLSNLPERAKALCEVLP